MKSFFFDGAAAEQEDDYIKRNLPIFKVARPKVIATETERRNFRIGNVVATRRRARTWERAAVVGVQTPGEEGARPQAVATADSADRHAAVHGRCYCRRRQNRQADTPAAALLQRAIHAEPQPAVVSKVLKLFELAPMYWDDESSVASSRIAKLCEPWVRGLSLTTGKRPEAASDGRKLHEQFLRR